MKLLFSFCSIFFLIFSFGCAHKMSKEMFFHDLMLLELATVIFEGYPEFIYCTDKDQTIMRDELTQLMNECVEEIKEKLPPVISSDESKAIGEEIGFCTGKKYLTEYSSYINAEKHSGNKRKKCEELQEKSKYFLKESGTN